MTAAAAQAGRGQVVPKRSVLSRSSASWSGMRFALTEEDVSASTDWGFVEPHHVIVLHLAGTISSLETVFENGPSARVLPSVGDLWMIPASRRYAARAQGGTVRYCELWLRPSTIGGRDLAPRIAHRDGFVQAALARLADLVGDKNDLKGLLADSIMEAIRLHLLATMVPAERARPARTTLDANARQMLIGSVREHLDAAHSLDSMAGLVGLDAPRFLTAFRAAFGTTPYQFVMRQRLDAAMRMLVESGAPITEIALSVGFATPSHFADIFRQKVGMSPRRYRQILRK